MKSQNYTTVMVDPSKKPDDFSIKELVLSMGKTNPLRWDKNQQGLAILVGVVLFIGLVLANGGNPRTCDMARSRLSDANTKLLQAGSSSEKARAADDVAKMQQKVDELCR